MLCDFCVNDTASGTRNFVFVNLTFGKPSIVCPTWLSKEPYPRLEAMNLTLAILREIIKVQVAFVSQDSISLLVPILNGVPQGDPASPFFFSATVDRLLTVCVSRWLRGKVGLPLEPDSTEEAPIHFPILRWMDDIYLFSSDPGDLQKMLRDVVLRFGRQDSSCNLLSASGARTTRAAARSSHLSSRTNLAESPGLPWI